MAEVRIIIPDNVVQTLQDKFGANVKLTDIAKDAMSLFNWAVGEKAAGRIVLSSDAELKSPRQITTPSLDIVKVDRK
jgi:hypothetical protein